MKITDYKGEDALELFVDILEPVSKIIQDKEFETLFKTVGFDKVGLGRPLLKNLVKKHKHEMIEIMARLEGEPVEEYSKNLTIFNITSKILSLFEDKELIDFFVSQGLKMDSMSSGSATENIEEAETI